MFSSITDTASKSHLNSRAEISRSRNIPALPLTPVKYNIIDDVNRKKTFMKKHFETC